MAFSPISDGESGASVRAKLNTLADVEAGATADQSSAEIETAYNAQVPAASQVEVEAGTEAAIRRLSPLRIAQAIAALASAGLNTLAKLNAIFTDGTVLIDTNDARLSDARTPLSHATSHTDGSDDIQSATNAQKGLATAAQITTLEANATHAALVAGNPHAVTASEVGLGSVENTALSTWGGSSSIVTVGTVVSGTWSGTPIAVAKGGTGQATAQAAIDALTQVSGATNEHVLTKDTATGNAVFKAAAGGGVTDHGALTGLGDDDHTQYHNDARGDARYSLLAHTHSAFSQDTAGFATGPTASDISSNYVLQADGDWVANAGGGGGTPGGSTTQFQYNNAGSFGGIANTVYASGQVTVASDNGSGTDNAGADLVLASGRSTGAATPAKGKLQGTVAATSGSTAQTLVDVLTWDGSVVNVSVPLKNNLAPLRQLDLLNSKLQSDAKLQLISGPNSTHGIQFLSQSGNEYILFHEIGAGNVGLRNVGFTAVYTNDITLGNRRFATAFDTVVGEVVLEGAHAWASATTNTSGGDIRLSAGDSASGAGKGGDIVLEAGSGVSTPGYVQYGTHNAIGAETITGYIEIKDSGGTVRKLAVVS